MSTPLIERAIELVLKRDVVGLSALAHEVRLAMTDVFGALVRVCILAPEGWVLGVVDYRQIEARALAWLAGADAALRAFADGIDVYLGFAARLFGVEPGCVTLDQRQLGKVCTLGCGFGMGSPRLHRYAENQGVNWGALSVTAEEAVEAWRDAHPEIAGRRSVSPQGFVRRMGGLWQKLNRAARLAATGASSTVGGLHWHREGADVHCVLPSGRAIVYPDAANETLPRQRFPGRRFTYLGRRGKRESSYGGKLAENVTQAVCRDLLADALVRLERAGFRVVLHVHDEVVAELRGPSELAEMKRIMLELPRWATGLPLDAEEHCARRYQKK